MAEQDLAWAGHGKIYRTGWINRKGMINKIGRVRLRQA
jgi:hypothetical protein